MARESAQAILCSVREPVLVPAFALVLVACGNNPPAELISRVDGGSDATSDVAVVDAAGGFAEASPYLGGPCVDDGQCDDGLACTYDSCDTSAGRCLNVPDDTQCQDGVYCDGQEVCVPGHGCEAGPVVSCDNGNECQIATCVEATRSCQYAERDVDQDGDPDAHCEPGHDCDDLNPNVSSLHAEVCSNGIDDNCNGLIDESPCVVPEGDTCAQAVPIAGPGNYLVSTLGANETFSTSCSVSAPSAGQDVVAAITVPPGANVDLEVWASTSSTEVAIALDATCGDATSELACGSGSGATDVRARARNVAPGTYFAVVTTQSASSVELMVGLLPPTSPATNVDCASATATSVPDVAHTWRSTFALPATVMATTTFSPAVGVVTLHDVSKVSSAPTVETGYVPAPVTDTAPAQVAPCGRTHGCSSTSPLQLSSMPLAHTSACRLETSGFRSSQSCPGTQWASGSPSPSTSRSVYVHDLVASTHVAIWQSLPLSQDTTAPGSQP